MLTYQYRIRIFQPLSLSPEIFLRHTEKKKENCSIQDIFFNGPVRLKTKNAIIDNMGCFTDHLLNFTNLVLNQKANK